MVPTKTAAEWSTGANAFINAPPAGVTVGNCPCNLPWGGSIAHGANVTAYSSTAPAAACSTVQETRTCSNGTLSGSFTNQSCTNGCTGTPWGNVSTGYSNTAYSSTAPSGVSCASVSQTRTCTNGSLSGSFTNTSCSSGCAAGATSNCNYVANTHGASSGTCAGGYSGSCSYSCSNGSRNLVSNSCAVACGGITYGPYCYYIGAAGQSCDTVCSAYGGCNLAGTQYVGSAGTTPMCDAIVTSFIGHCGISSFAGGSIGCLKATSGCGGIRWQGTTTCAGTNGSSRRICACNN